MFCQGACGDVNRNVMAAPAPWKDRADYLDAENVAEDIANLLAPQAGSYYDVWLDGEKWYSETFEVSPGSRAGDSVSAPGAWACLDTAVHWYRECLQAGMLSHLLMTGVERLQRPHVTAARDFNGFGTNFVGSPEPIYGAQYLPRKFKVLGWELANALTHACLRAYRGQLPVLGGMRRVIHRYRWYACRLGSQCRATTASMC